MPLTHGGRAGSAWLSGWLWLEQAWRDFLYLVMPGECVVCRREDASLCPACSAVLRRQTARPFRAERSADALVGVSGEPRLLVVAGGEYRDALAATILGFKNHGRTDLSAPLCRVLARVLEHAVAGLAGPAPVSARDGTRQDFPLQTGPGHGGPMAGGCRRNDTIWLVPIPSTGSGWRRRGYDPVALILRALRSEGRLPQGVVVAKMLGIKARLPWHRQHQKGLGRAARRSNVRDTMKIKHIWGRQFRLLANPNAPTVLLLDDVLTTGSTLREAAKTLEKSGFVVCGAVVLAAARAPEGDG